jgi:glycosyltransferase involved in cell wall biosynthesis
VYLLSLSREGIPKSLIEPAACGYSSITTNVQGYREIIRHGENGLLVNSRNAIGWAEGLKYLVLNPKVRAKMGFTGRMIGGEGYSAQQIWDVDQSC